MTKAQDGPVGRLFGFSNVCSDCGHEIGDHIYCGEGVKARCPARLAAQADAPGGQPQSPLKRPDSIYSKYHLENWSDVDFANHPSATRKTLAWLLELEAALSDTRPVLPVDHGDGVMVLASRQAIHEVAESHEKLRRTLEQRSVRLMGPRSPFWQCEYCQALSQTPIAFKHKPECLMADSPSVGKGEA